MKVYCVEDAPIAPFPSLERSHEQLDRGVTKRFAKESDGVDKDERVNNVIVGDQSTKKDGMDNNIKTSSNNINNNEEVNNGWPVIIMCHGLGGTRALYSQLCITLASR